MREEAKRTMRLFLPQTTLSSSASKFDPLPKQVCVVCHWDYKPSQFGLNSSYFTAIGKEEMQSRMNRLSTHRCLRIESAASIYAASFARNPISPNLLLLSRMPSHPVYSVSDFIFLLFIIYYYLDNILPLQCNLLDFQFLS